MTDQHIPDSLPRSASDERQYLLRRADEHRQLAEKADEPGSRTAHVRLQQLYLDKARQVLGTS
jgi:hypothetical protein